MLNKEQLDAMKPSERIQFLSDNAYKLEQGSYFKRMTTDELVSVKDFYSEEQIKLRTLEDEFTGIKAKYKGEIDSKKEENDAVLNKIKQKGEFKSGNTFLFDDQTNGVMYTYDEQGQMVNYRPLRVDEKQMSIHSIKLAADKS